MGQTINIGLLGLGTVGTGVARILQTPEGRHPLVKDLNLSKVVVRDLEKTRDIYLPKTLVSQNANEVVNDPNIDVVVEVMGGLEPARTLILSAISAGKSVVTANKAVIARHGKEIALAAAESGVYVLIEAAVGGGIPIIEPIKQSLGANRIKRISGIINGTTNYMLTRMATEKIAYEDVLKTAQELGFAEANPAADVEGLDAADKIAILSGLAFGGHIDRSQISTEGIQNIKSQDVEYANKLGYRIKLLAVAESIESNNLVKSLPLSIRVQPTLLSKDHPLSGVNDVNNAILIEGEPVGKVMFYGPGAGAGPTASAVVADILNIAGIQQLNKANNQLDLLLSASSWRDCHIIPFQEVIHKHYIRLKTNDTPGVIGQIGGHLEKNGVSIQSILQFDSTKEEAEIVVITHKASQGNIEKSLKSIESLPEIKGIEAHMGCI